MNALTSIQIVISIFSRSFCFFQKQKVMPKQEELLSIALHDGVNAEGSLYRLKRGTKLRLVPGSSLLGRNVAIWCNYPVNGEFFFCTSSISVYQFVEIILICRIFEFLIFR